ncbi:uncharacterized protein LOC114542024 isoform X2 [Dendronephthya gigantea]|uniref:uncharacterized protein LOC114542024 isoform X2 n=1 Tax=Dendronephthya gigantea TaxID=151771 RepID=UPI00106C5A77|nr:uncharacterized protein LOC114542024 isoform X2 [Dendronephthya gigantea]
MQKISRVNCSRSQGGSTSGALASQEVRKLFHNNRRGSKKGTKQSRKRTWTAQMVCLADRMAYKVPTAAEKQVLFKAGLGCKKIKFDVDDDEETVVKKITSSETENGSSEVLGFPQLNYDCGVFELMRCVANCRELVVVDGSWSVKDLKANGGPQAKIYLRPIQKSVLTKPLFSRKKSEVKEKCISCDQEFLVHELRKHSFRCTKMFDTSDEGEEEKQEDVTHIPNDGPGQTDDLEIEPFIMSSVASESVISITVQLPTLQVSVNHATPPIIIDPDESVSDTHEKTVDNIIAELVQYCHSNDVSDPVEILSCYQSMFVKGRALEIKDPSVCEEDDTNIIFIDRENVLDTGFDEIDQIQNLRTTLEIEFYGESAKNYGGPRKEFFVLILNAIKHKYFDKGLRKHFCDQYETVGKILGLSIVQNGKIPKFIDDEILERLLQINPNEDSCIIQLRKGLKQIGIIQISKTDANI